MTAVFTKKIKNNLDIYVLMSNYNISPKILKINGNKITMEKYDGTLDFLYNFYSDFPVELELKITKLILTMHSMDIAHGDLHPRNIVYKIIDGETIFRIIDFDDSFHISTGENDEIVTKFRQNAFVEDISGDYGEFVKYDYENWKNSFISENTISFKEIDDLIDRRADIGSSIMAQLSLEFNFKLFGVFTVDKDEISINQSWTNANVLALQLPNNEYYIGYNVIKPNKEMYTMQEIRKFCLLPNKFKRQNDSDVDCLFVDITNVIQSDTRKKLNDDLIDEISNFAIKYLD